MDSNQTPNEQNQNPQSQPSKEPVISSESQGVYINSEIQNGNVQPAETEAPQKDGLAVAALVLGIVSLVFSTVCCCCVLPIYFAPVLAIAGIICAAISRSKRGAFSNMALAGLICSIIGIISSVAIIIALAVGSLTAEIDVSELYDYFNI